MNSWTFLCLWILDAILYFTKVDSLCYFPVEYHGTFMIQTQTSGSYSHTATTFSEVTIDADAIPPWGRCHRRRGNNVILKDSTGGEDCMRCFHLTLKTPNVIQIHMEGLGKCYTKEESVRATCPDDRAVYERRFKEIMLYRKPQSTVPSPLSQVFCPVSGKFRFTYSANNGEFKCDQTLSDLSNCPLGNGLVVRFRQCSFPNLDAKFQCLGDWEGPNNDRYLALLEVKEEPDAVTKYRCGMYRHDSATGRVYVSLSADSTCYNHLRSATDGYESLILTPFPERSLPALVQHTRCRFPDWAQGQWENGQVNSNLMVFHDHTHLQKVNSRCIRRENNTPNDHFIVFTSTHCGQESYNCLWLKRRGANIMEFLIGAPSNHEHVEDLCADHQFRLSSWTTQGRKRPLEISPCPITGDYTGVVPGTNGLCAKVASDCNNPDIMFYTVSSCENRSHVFEEREYRCLGSWEENGVTFTYTQRRDMDGFQCFSGKVLHGGKEAYIKEAGESCIRGDDPYLYGMKITKHASCPEPPLKPLPPRTTRRPPVPSVDLYDRPTGKDTFWFEEETNHLTTKPKKSITGEPNIDHSNGSSQMLSSIASVIFSILIVLMISPQG